MDSKKFICIICIITGTFGVKVPDGVCVTKIVNGKLVQIGDCEKNDGSEIARSIKRSIDMKKKQKLPDLQSWHRARNNYYYKVFNDEVNYETAQSNCLQYGANLASAGVRDQVVFRELLSLITASGGGFTWVGLKKTEKKEILIWMDGVVVKEDSINWADGEPNSRGGVEDCVVMWYGVQVEEFNDFACSETNKYICEIKV